MFYLIDIYIVYFWTVNIWVLSISVWFNVFLIMDILVDWFMNINKTVSSFNVLWYRYNRKLRFRKCKYYNFTLRRKRDAEKIILCMLNTMSINIVYCHVWLIDWIEVYAIAVIFQPCNSGIAMYILRIYKITQEANRP